jgi:beta-lactamase class A
MIIRRVAPSLAGVFMLVLCGPLQAQSKASLQQDLHAKLEAEFLREAGDLHGVMGYFIQDLATGETFEHNADLVFPTASSIKVAVLLELLHQDQEGKLSLDEKHTVVRGETVAGDPILYMLGDGTVSMTLSDVATFMVVLSDNSATNILIERVGMANVNARVESLGLSQTHLRRKMIDLEAARQGNENVSTPRELSQLLVKVRSGAVLDPAHMKRYLELLALPKDSLFNKALPSGTVIEDKPGALEGVRCDAGIIEIAGHPFVMTVMTTYLADENEGERAVEALARQAYEHFMRLARASSYGRVISEK